MHPDIFTDENSFKQAFHHGLQDILQQPDLGCFILVCANAFGDPELHRQLLPEIERQFVFLQAAMSSDALDTGEITATEDDREIFLMIMQQGLDAIPIV